MSWGRPVRWLGCAGFVAGLGCIAVTAGAATREDPAHTSHRATQRKAAVSPWEQAESARDALEGTPESDRTRADYNRVMDAYRAIYHSNPADIHAPAAINSVAELLAEQGRVQHDTKSSKAAVGQYEFLRKQYPASSLGLQALLAEAQIQQNDLGDSAAAIDTYKLLLKEHPKSEQAEEARAGLAALQPPSSKAQRVSSAERSSEARASHA